MGAEESPCTATPHDGGSDKTGQALWRGNWLLTNHLTRKRRRKLCKVRPSAHGCMVAVLYSRIPTCGGCEVAVRLAQIGHRAVWKWVAGVLYCWGARPHNVTSHIVGRSMPLASSPPPSAARSQFFHRCHRALDGLFISPHYCISRPKIGCGSRSPVAEKPLAVDASSPSITVPQEITIHAGGPWFYRGEPSASLSLRRCQGKKLGEAPLPAGSGQSTTVTQGLLSLSLVTQGMRTIVD
jgi:hypothetical protein